VGEFTNVKLHPHPHTSGRKPAGDLKSEPELLSLVKVDVKVKVDNHLKIEEVESL
jgi:hypothetical protein